MTGQWVEGSRGSGDEVGGVEDECVARGDRGGKGGAVCEEEGVGGVEKRREVRGDGEGEGVFVIG